MTHTAVTKVALGRAIAASLVSLMFACGGDGTTTGLPDQNPVPTITEVSPAQTFSGQTAFSLTVEGTNFISSSVVRWNGSDRSTTYVDGGTLRALVPASDVAAAGTTSITVFNPPPGGGVSTSFSVSVINPVPSLTTLSPDTAITGQDGFILTVQGTNFVMASVVRWNGSDRPTTLVTGQMLGAAIPATDVATAGMASITVFTPPPGGGLSDTLTVPVVTLVPSVTALSQRAAMAGQAAFTLTVAGANFTTTSVLRWNGADRPTSYVDGETLQAAIPASDVAMADTATIRVFTPPPGGGTSDSVAFPILSPPTGQMVFVSDRDGNREIYVMKADGTEQTNLTNSSADDANPAWSPDGSKIAFVSDRDGNREVYVMNADGTGLVNLTNNPADDWRIPAADVDEAPAWSPDGSRILFSSNRDGNWEVYGMNADGSGQLNLTNRPDPDWYPKWSPDGSEILWVTSPAFLVTEIYVMNADGTGQVNLTNAPNSGNNLPAWSPNGSQIAFVTDRDVPSGLLGEVYIINADGTNPVDLTNSSADDLAPRWSPDGARIAFLSHNQQSWALKRIDADGTNEVYLSNSSPTQYAWSRDGSWIAFYRNASGGGDIYLTDVDGLLQVNLTNTAGVDKKPGWRPTP